MKIVWLVLASAALLSPAAANSSEFDNNCPRPTASTEPPFEYDRQTIESDEGYVELNISCNQEVIHWMESVKEPPGGLLSYRIEFTCLEVEATVLATLDNPGVNGVLYWADLNATTCKFYGVSEGGVDQCCYLIEPFRVNRSECPDINECERGLDNCSIFGMCNDTFGSFTCECLPGFEGDGVNCSDVRECDRGLDNCSPYANCTDTAGSFFCTCDPAFTGDGVNCTAIDECVLFDVCDPNAECNDTLGTFDTFDCFCRVGYSGDGFNCTDIDECATDTDNCHPEANCSNTEGSFMCMCNVPAFTGNGTFCEAVTVPTNPLDSGGIKTYIPVVIVIFGFLVLIAATTIGIAIFKYKSHRSKIYNSHVYFTQEVDPKFSPIKIHSSVSVSQSMQTIFHSLEVDYYEKDLSEVRSQTDIVSPVSPDLPKTKPSDSKRIDEMEAENDDVPIIQQDNKSMAQNRETITESYPSSKSGYVTEQLKKADTDFDLNSEADRCSLVLYHSLPLASSDSKVSVVMTSDNGGYVYNDSNERSVVLQNTMNPDHKKATQSGDTYIQSSSSESSGYVTEPSTKADMGASDSEFSLNSGESLQFLSHDSKTPVVANDESSGYVYDDCDEQPQTLQDEQCSLCLEDDESPVSSALSDGTVAVASSGYVAEANNGYVRELSPHMTESDADSLVPAVCFTLGDDTYLRSEELGVEFEPVPCSDYQRASTMSSGYVSSPALVTTTTASHYLPTPCGSRSAQDTSRQYQTSMSDDYMSESNLNIDRQISTSDSDGYMY